MSNDEADKITTEEMAMIKSGELMRIAEENTKRDSSHVNTHKPNDQGDHFPDFHRQDRRLRALETDVWKLEQRTAKLEAALAKQHMANEALLTWFEAPGYEERNMRSDTLIIAIRKGLE